MSEKDFTKELALLGIEVTEKQKRLLETYYETLIKWNDRFGLTAITDKEQVYLKHFYDSLTIVKVADLNECNSLCDFGSGAGFPGVVLKIMYPHLKITLIDSLQKKTNFLRILIQELNLKDIEVETCRVEDYHKQNFDIITCRAVSNLSQLIIYAKHLISKKTAFVIYKGNIEEELNAAQQKIKSYRLSITKKEEFHLPIEESKRTLLVIKSIGK